MHVRTFSLRALLTAAVLLVTAAPAGAQAFAYPSFQAPRVSNEYNFGLADAEDITSLLFQWRVARASRSQLSLDLGFSDIDGASDGVLFVGGQYARQLATANASTPFDALFTVGANFATTDGFSMLRVPVGVSVGHRFPLEGGLALTPYVHPRLVIANCGDCGGPDDDDTDLGLEFDIGADFEFSPQFSLRVSAMFGGNDFIDDDAFGISLAWRPGRR